MSSRETYPSYFEHKTDGVEIASMVSLTAEATLWLGSRVDQTRAIQDDIREENPPYKKPVVSIRFGGASAQPRGAAPIEELFANVERTSRLKRALELLDEAIKLAEAALSADADLVAFDDNMQVLYSLLPELFCCRSLGDGFASVVNAIQQAVANQRGIPMNGNQAEAVLIALRELKRSPFLPHSDAVELVMRLEDANLVVDPPALSQIVEIPPHEETGVR